MMELLTRLICWSAWFKQYTLYISLMSREYSFKNLSSKVYVSFFKECNYFENWVFRRKCLNWEKDVVYGGTGKLSISLIHPSISSRIQLDGWENEGDGRDYFCLTTSLASGGPRCVKPRYLTLKINPPNKLKNMNRINVFLSICQNFIFIFLENVNFKHMIGELISFSK